MELMFLKEDVAEAMKVVSKAVGSSSMTMLSNLLISTAYDPMAELLSSETNKRIYLAATDLEIGIRSCISGQIIDGGAITIPARKFAAIIREMPDSEIHLATTSADRVNIDCGSARFRLAGAPPDDFPSLIPKVYSEAQPELIVQKKDSQDQPFVSMYAGILLAMVQRTSFAASRDEIQYFLNGVLMHLKPEGMDCLVKMAATDGRRLATASAKGEECSFEEKQAIIPIKAVECLKDMLSDVHAVKVILNESRIIFDTGEMTLVSRLIEGQYPDYERVIPVDNSIKLTVETEQLLSVLRRVSTMANLNLPCVKMEATGDILKVSSSTPEFGEAQEEMPIKKEGDNILIGLNARYLMDVLKVTDAESVIMEMSEPLKPVVLRPASDSGYLSVIMPMHI